MITRRRSVMVLTLIALAALVLSSAPAAGESISPHYLAVSAANASVPVGSSSLPEGQLPATPLLFVENAGQWPAAARFQLWGSPAGTGTTWLAEDAIWISIAEETSPPTPPLKGEGSDAPPAPPSLGGKGAGGLGVGVNLKLTFPNANPHPRIEPFSPLTTTVSYFIGDDSEQWRPAVPVYGGVRYLDLYPGVDLVLDSRDGVWRLEATPGAARDRVRIQVEGAAIVALDGATLKLDGPREPLSIALPTAPFAYQAIGASPTGTPLALPVHPGLHASQAQRPNDDPGDLLYSTFLGGSDYDRGGVQSISVDATGSAYVTGYTDSGDFPTTPGAFDPSDNAGSDAFVVKLNPTGSALAYATFLGGSNNDEGRGIVVDGAGSAYVTGATSSSDFPTTPGAFDPSYNGNEDAFVAKLNPTGSALDYATFLGGSHEDFGNAIAVGAMGSAYLVGGTNSSDFPTTPGALDPNYNGGICMPYPLGCPDSFVVKLNAAGRGLVYSTFLGGSRDDIGGNIAVDAMDKAYLSGSTRSGDFPTTPGAFDRTFGGGECGTPPFFSYPCGDAFVAKVNPTGSALDYATFLGGSNDEIGQGIVVDRAGSAYVTGGTNSSDFPTTPGALDPNYNGGICMAYPLGCPDSFVAKLNPTGSTLAYATFLGGSHEDSGDAIAVDGAGRAYVSGFTLSSDFPTTPGAFDTSYNGGIDVIVLVLNSTGSALVYATFLGGSHQDFGSGIVVGGTANAYVMGASTSSDFPTTPGAFDTSHNGGGPDAFVVKLDMYVPDVLAPVEQPPAGGFVTDLVTLRGFAIDLGSPSGTGIDAVHIYLDGPSGTGAFVGQATYGLNRPDIAAQYGARFGPSGWELAWDTSAVAPGVHQLYLYAHRTTDNTWSEMPPHLVVVRADHVYWLPLGGKN